MSQSKSQKKYMNKPGIRERFREYYAEWYKKNGRNRAIDYTEAIIEWRNNHPDGVRAQAILNYAIKSGKIIKPKNCEKCTKEKRLCAHHDDYSKPLKVKWLCSSCHKIEHAIKKRG